MHNHNFCCQRDNALYSDVQLDIYPNPVMKSFRSIILKIEKNTEFSV